jgi:DNA mismatch repair protein MutS2
VAVGAVKMHVPADTLRPWQQTPPPGTVPVSAPTPEADARPEIDLRGFRAADIEDALVHAIDAAVQADLPALRIIHGKGTGALRDRVAEVLRQDRRVKHVRLGVWNEGGGGVTVAELA